MPLSSSSLSPHAPDVPAAGVDMAVALLLPLLLAATGGDATDARALALRSLQDYRPQTVQELAIAAEAIGHGLKSLTLLAQSADPGLIPQKADIAVRRACSLSRAGHQAQRRLEALQRARRSAAPDEHTQAVVAAHSQAVQPDEIAPPVLEPQPAAETEPVPLTALPTDVAEAEATLASAEKLLGLMKARVKGALPPHSKAVQRIQDQQRVVETARLRLRLARKTEADAAQPWQAPDLAA